VCLWQPPGVASLGPGWLRGCQAVTSVCSSWGVPRGALWSSGAREGTSVWWLQYSPPRQPRVHPHKQYPGGSYPLITASETGAVGGLTGGSASGDAAGDGAPAGGAKTIAGAGGSGEGDLGCARGLPWTPGKHSPMKPPLPLPPLGPSAGLVGDSTREESRGTGERESLGKWKEGERGKQRPVHPRPGYGGWQ